MERLMQRKHINEGSQEFDDESEVGSVRKCVGKCSRTSL